MPDFGFNFRNTIAFVTDGADDTYVIRDAGYNEQYPRTRDGVCFGWTTQFDTSRNRDATVDVRIAGTHFSYSTTRRDFQVDLAGLNGTGEYTIRGGFGDAYQASSVYCQLLDNTTVFATVNETLTGSERMVDPTGVHHTNANWPGSNNTVVRTFSNNTFFLRLTDSGLTTPGAVAHLSFNWAAGTSPVLGQLQQSNLGADLYNGTFQ